jgi:hypothetical protein
MIHNFGQKIRELVPIVHVPSLKPAIDSLYDAVERRTFVDWGVVALLLGLYSTSTQSWLHGREDTSPGFLPQTEGQTAQSSFWLKPLFNVLEYIKRTRNFSLETLQGACFGYTTLANTHGLTAHARHLVAECTAMSRELGLHRIDYTNPATLSTSVARDEVKTEIGRRLWWFIVTLDW